MKISKQPTTENPVVPQFEIVGTGGTGPMPHSFARIADERGRHLTSPLTQHKKLRTLPGYPMLWQITGPGTTINLSQGLPYYHGVVMYPSPILASPYMEPNILIINGLTNKPLNCIRF